MNYLLPLILSGVFITIAHSTLLVRHKDNRKWSISEHAVLSKRSLLLYRLSHLLTGLLFLCFSWLYFVNTVSMPAFFIITAWTVVFEYAQAILPAKGDTNKLHTITALIMWASFILFGILCILFMPVNLTNKIIASIIYMALILSLIYTSRNREKLYFNQVTMVALFYAAIIILVA